jgi:hypothetical protein
VNDGSLLLQGRSIGVAELDQIRALIGAQAEASRYRLSRLLCEAWDWRSATGQLKDMAARALLLKLEQRGQVRLPTRGCASPNRMRHKRVPPPPPVGETVEAPLGALQPLQIEELSATAVAHRTDCVRIPLGNPDNLNNS